MFGKTDKFSYGRIHKKIFLKMSYTKSHLQKTMIMYEPQMT